MWKRKKTTTEDESEMKIIGTLYTDFRQLLFKKARLILNSDTDAEDAVQAAFMRLIDNLSIIRGHSIEENKKYLFIVVKGIALDMLKKKSSTVELTDDIPSTYDVDETTEVHITYEEVMNNINELSPALKNIAGLFWIQNLSEQEIANTLNMNINTVRSHIYRARKILSEKNKEESHHD